MTSERLDAVPGIGDCIGVVSCGRATSVSRWIKDIAYRFTKDQFVTYAKVEVDGVIGLTSKTLVAFVSGEQRYPSTEQLDKVIALIQKICVVFHSRRYCVYTFFCVSVLGYPC